MSTGENFKPVRQKRTPMKVLLSVAFAFLPLASAMTVALTPSTSSPAAVATPVTFNATVSGAASGTIWYRFRYHGYDQDSQLIQDFGPNNTLVWTASDHEGSYEIDVDAENLSTSEVESGSAYFTFQSLVTGTQPVISPTSHPMVFLYSAPPCKKGSRMRVMFSGPDNVSHATPYQSCKAGSSMNFYLAGLLGSTAYSVMHEIDTGSAFQNGPVMTLTTLAAPTNLTPVPVVQAAPASAPDGILLQSTLLVNPIATDLNGNLVWYYPNSDVTYFTRAVAGGYFYGVQENTTGDQSYQVVRKVDLVGRTVLSTNAARVNQQLKALGKRSIDAFHHEARELPDGNILVLGGVEQILTNVQGSGPIDILGDMIIVLNPQLQVLWTWDTFDHLDTTRQATLADQCLPGDCPPLYLATIANDWTHGNSVQQTPDGNLLYSARAQDRVFKIDYENGSGSGAIIWTLGSGGDFQIQSNDPLPWFSHQHDPQFLEDNTTLLLFDNGNLRNLTDPTQNSRGQVLEVNTQTMTATLTFNYDVGQFSVALGAAQKLPNGDYHFDSSYVANGLTYAIEVTPAGKSIFSLNPQAPEYRSFRMPDLYHPPYGTH
jgi:arylsulfate sulfotransferase